MYVDENTCRRGASASTKHNTTTESANPCRRVVAGEDYVYECQKLPRIFIFKQKNYVIMRSKKIFSCL